MQRYIHDIIIAIESIITNRLKSILTALGIIFGVAAVISMLAIGKGAKQEILEQMKLVGVNNIIISAQVKSDKELFEENINKKENKKFSRGLTLLDAQSIKEVIPNVKKVSPEILLELPVVRKGKYKNATLMGIESVYFDIFSISLLEGKVFNNFQKEKGLPVCIVNKQVKIKLFNNADPIGQYLKCGNEWLKVIGVAEDRSFNFPSPLPNKTDAVPLIVYLPVKTVLMRYENRALITEQMIKAAAAINGRNSGNGNNNSSKEVPKENYHQLDRITVQVEETEQLKSTERVLQRLFERRHSGVPDFSITIPELLLKQQQRTKDIFNIVLGAIASISLLVGGIGIMNIMFASVMERIKEIGTRLALGAKKTDIIVQFLAEASLISIIGGIVGIVLGFILSKLITHFAGILTIVSPFSVFIAFFVSASIGIIFGYSPAKKAAEKDPIESLRYE